MAQRKKRSRAKLSMTVYAIGTQPRVKIRVNQVRILPAKQLGRSYSEVGGEIETRSGMKTVFPV